MRHAIAVLHGTALTIEDMVSLLPDFVDFSNSKIRHLIIRQL